MSEASLRDKLRRLRRPAVTTAAAVPPTGELDRLEESLLGGCAEELPLKARLERLVAAASRGRAARDDGVAEAWTGPRSNIESLVQGLRVENERGEFFLAESGIHLETYHGEVPLSRLRAVLPGSVGVLTGEAELGGFDLARAVFLDTETTGLAGGTGTAAFLIGIGFVDRDSFCVRQYFMRDYHEEAALLAGLAADLRRFGHLVTFNGKMFDVPLLESRYRLNRDRFPLTEAPHLDLLHPARRLWKLRLESCRLQSLERALLGIERRGDIAGEEIPRIYFDYVRRRDARALARVFDHNRLDIVSLVALAVLACQWVEEGRAEDPQDVLSLARVLERAELHERSEAEYRRALETDEETVRVPALHRLAMRARRAGDYVSAAGYWEQAAESGDWVALRALAIHHEHRSHDLPAALAAAEQGLELAGSCEDPRGRRTASDFRRRRARVIRKMAER